jgi:hypothetical protein
MDATVPVSLVGDRALRLLGVATGPASLGQFLILLFSLEFGWRRLLASEVAVIAAVIVGFMLSVRFVCGLRLTDRRG